MSATEAARGARGIGGSVVHVLKQTGATLYLGLGLPETPGMAALGISPRMRVVPRYVALGLVGFVFFLVLTFPYDAIRQRITQEARSVGLYVRIGSLGPGFFGVRARDVQVSMLSDGSEAKPPEPLKIDALSLRPSLFPLGVAMGAKLMGGTVSLVAGGLSARSLDLTLEGLSLSGGNLKGFSGLDLEGTVDGQLTLDVPAVTGPEAKGGHANDPNLAEASGGASLNLKRVTIRGGTLPGSFPLDLPRLVLGNVDANLKFEKGQGTLDRLTAQGGDLEVRGIGTLKLAKQLSYSEMTLGVKMKPTPELLKNGIIGMGMSALPEDPATPGFRCARGSGFLGRPNFLPGC